MLAYSQMPQRGIQLPADSKIERELDSKIKFSAEDKDIFDSTHWHAYRGTKKLEAKEVFYVQATHGGRGRKYFHRAVMERVLCRKILSGEIVDHINFDGLDNRRENLRLCTKGENVFHQRLRKNNASGLRGISFDKTRNAWKSQIRWKNKAYLIGRYPTKRDAL